MLLLLVTLMLFSVMAQEKDPYDYEPVSKQTIVNLVCMPTTTTICTDLCSTFNQEEVKRKKFTPVSNLNLRVSETQVYGGTYYAMDRGNGFGFQQAQFVNNTVMIVLDGDEPPLAEDNTKGKYLTYILNLLNSEYDYSVVGKEDGKTFFSQKYDCKEAKSLFD